MELSAFAFTTTLLLIPGIIGSLVIEAVTVKNPWSQFRFIVYSILIGFISYVILYWIKGNDSDALLKLSRGEISAISDIGYASAIAILEGVIMSFLINKKSINDFARWIKLSNKYGDESLYYFYLRSQEVKEVYIHVKDMDRIYHGLIDSFSQTAETCEIVLVDASIYYYEDATLLYRVDKVYISRPISQLIIEAYAPANQANKPDGK